MTTGLSATSFQKLQLNAGIFLTGFDYSKLTDKATMKAALAKVISERTGVLGATRGGGSFTCTPEIRNIEADGKRYEFVGSTINDGWTVKLSTTLLESDAASFKLALMSADLTGDEDDGVQTIKIRTDIQDSDYLKNLCWVGDTSKGYVLIALKNALNISGASFSFSDKGEGTLPVEFQAHQSGIEDSEHAPCEVVFFTEKKETATDNT